MAKIILGFILGAVSACVASPEFPYKFYTLDADSYDGQLLGPTADLDVALSQCKPTETDKAPCVVMKADAFVSMQLDYKTTKLNLINCESNHGSEN